LNLQDSYPKKQLNRTLRRKTSLRCFGAVLSLLFFWAQGCRIKNEQKEVVLSKSGLSGEVAVHNDPANRVLTVTMRTSWMTPPPLVFQMPIDGWITSQTIELRDWSANLVPVGMLHHIVFSNPARLDSLCPSRPERMFVSGGLGATYPIEAGWGYRVHNGDRIRIDAMFHMAMPIEVIVRMHYQPAGKGESPLRNLYPVWLDVQGCELGPGHIGYDIGPHGDVRHGDLVVPYSGRLIFIVPHLHDFGRQLQVDDLTRDENILMLNSHLDAEGRLLELRNVSWQERGGYRVKQGDVIRTTAVYENPTGKLIRLGAMGLVVAYFLPDDDNAMTAFARTRPKQRWITRRRLVFAAQALVLLVLAACLVWIRSSERRRKRC
jgi:hypothetical protein